MEPEDPPPREQGSQTIQLPYFNKFETIWEYEESFLSGQIDFVSFIGVRWHPLLVDLVYGYSRRTSQFLFGTASQYRRPLRP